MIGKIVFIPKSFKQSLEFNNIDIEQFLAKLNNSDSEGVKVITDKISFNDMENFLHINNYIKRYLEPRRGKCKNLTNSFEHSVIIKALKYSIDSNFNYINNERKKISTNDICVINNIDIREEIKIVDYGDTVVVFLNKNLYNGILVETKKFLIEIISQLFDNLGSSRVDLKGLLSKALVNLA